jgi:hypothetical protein
MDFIILASWGKGHKWRRFLSFLQQQRIPVDARGLFWYLLPARLWPRGVSTVDADLFERRLVETMEAAIRRRS